MRRNFPIFTCSFVDAADQEIMVGGRKVCFDYSDRFGPLVLNEDGTEADKQPVDESDPFWPPFNAWLTEWRAAREQTRP